MRGLSHRPATQLRAALSSESIWIVVLTGTVILDPADWATPVRLAHDVQVQGYDTDTSAFREDPSPALVTLDCNGLSNIIQIGEGSALQLYRLELLNHMRHDGTPDAYAKGMPIIDAAASGAGTLIWRMVVSYVPVGLPLDSIAAYAKNRVYWTLEDEGYFTKTDADYRANTIANVVLTSGTAANAYYCYMASRRYNEICRPKVRLVVCGGGGGGGVASRGLGARMHAHVCVWYAEKYRRTAQQVRSGGMPKPWAGGSASSSTRARLGLAVVAACMHMCALRSAPAPAGPADAAGAVCSPTQWRLCPCALSLSA